VRFFIELAYDGGAYHGWQRQPNALTVQEVLEEVLGKFTGEPAYLTGQGRTDTGVHARQFFAHWDCVAPPVELLANPEAWVHTLNRILPADVSVQQILEGKSSRPCPVLGLVSNLRVPNPLDQKPFQERLFLANSGRAPLG